MNGKIADQNESMYINGRLFENQDSLNSLINIANGFAINVNESGHLLLKGTLTQNGNP